MTCRICDRELSAPKSIERGVGPVCARKNAERVAAGEEHDLVDIPYAGEKIVCRRDDNGQCHFNIYQRVTDHSPTGMEWGYGGSGPADYALNILALFTDMKTAYCLHQDFKWEFIAPMPREGGEIEISTIKAWIQEKAPELFTGDELVYSSGVR